MKPNDETAIISDPEVAREKFEQARLSRRAALRKIGITSSMAFFGLFAVDDLARLAIKKMEENKQLHEVGETVAQEFKNSGIAFAGAAGSSSVNSCQHCCNALQIDDNICNCEDQSDQAECFNNAKYRFDNCYDKHCTGGPCSAAIAVQQHPSGPCPPTTTT